MNKHAGPVFLGALICWLLNAAQLGIALLLLAASEKMLPTVYVLIFAIGLVQAGYVAPLYRLLRRKGKPGTALGLIIGAATTALVNLATVYWFFGFHIPDFWR